jgi:hypothetical protein
MQIKYQKGKKLILGPTRNNNIKMYDEVLRVVVMIFWDTMSWMNFNGLHDVMSQKIGTIN